MNNDRELEAKYLRDVAAAEAEADAKVQMQKDKLRQEMIEYRKSLMNQACKDKEGEAEYETNVQKEYEAICAREDAVQRAREESRQRLDQEVYTVRTQQIHEKEALR